MMPASGSGGSRTTVTVTPANGGSDGSGSPTVMPASGGAGSSKLWDAKPSYTFQSLFGVHVGGSSTSDSAAAFAMGASDTLAGYVTHGFFTARATHFAELARGGAGTEGVLSVDLAVGARVPFAATHGPFLRIGFRGMMMGNESAWLSNFELPQGQLGYEFGDGPWLVEVAARTGIVLVGRHRAYVTLPGSVDAFVQRRLETSAELGAHAAVGYRRLLLHGEVARVYVHDGIDTPVDSLVAELCVRPDWIGVCASYRLWTADLARADGVQPFTVATGGVSIGFWTP